MNLTRVGANRREIQGVAFENETPSVSIDSTDGSISLLVSNSSGMGSSGRYNYTVELSIEDLMLVLQKLSSTRAIFADGPLKSKLEQNTSCLLRLMTAAASLPYQLAPTAAQIRLRELKERQG